MFVTLAALPEWLDAERLQWASWGLTGLLVIVGLLVVRFVQRLLTNHKRVIITRDHESFVT